MILGTKKNPHLVDTLVMANLGYWQMKVSPGVWYLQLAPGRSSDLYILQDGPKTQSTKRIIIDYLRGKPVHLGVVKKKGKEHEKLLIPSDEESSGKQVGLPLFLYLVKRIFYQNLINEFMVLLGIFQGDRERWNSNILKWASSLIGGNAQSKSNGNNKVVNDFLTIKPKSIFEFVN